ncbi:MAG: hypothetical protein AAFV80_19555, partial [Bacteroidota bacterium]
MTQGINIIDVSTSISDWLSVREKKQTSGLRRVKENISYIFPYLLSIPVFFFMKREIMKKKRELNKLVITSANYATIKAMHSKLSRATSKVDELPKDVLLSLPFFL